jgi:hypothetical protein
VHDRFDHSLRMTVADCLKDVGVGGGEGDSGARLCEIDYCQSNDERGGR